MPILYLLALVFFGEANSPRSKVEWTKDTLEVVKQNIEKEKAVLVDVRSEQEWNKGHIEGAIFLPVTSLQSKGNDPKQLEKKLPKDKTIYTYCVVGMRAKSAAYSLEQAGFNVQALKSGYEELLKAGFKKATPTPSEDPPAATPHNETAASAPKAQPTATKDDATPDFCQTDKEGEFDNGGRVFCGPVAISNSLMCLAETGYPQLISKSDTPKKSQIELIRTLASPDYMHTHGTGTNTLRLMRGANKYITEHGYTCSQLEYRGWRKVNKELKPSEELPTIDWMAAALTQTAGSACVNIGWYTYDEPTNTYIRRGGHWMTGTAAYSKDKLAYVTLLDPASRSGLGKVVHQARVEQLKKSAIDDPAKDDDPDDKHELDDTTGLLVIREGIVPKQYDKDQKTFPVIDGVVIMVLK